MSQHDYIIDNALAPAFRADLNAALGAIVTQNSGTSAPSTTYANMVWYDTTNDLLKIRNEANSGWITMGTIDQANSAFNPNFIPATQVDAEAGTDNVKGMTPLRVAQAVAALGGSGGVNIQVFTASGTYTPTSGYKYGIAFVTGGGEGTRGIGSNDDARNGGSSSGTAIGVLNLTTLGSVAATVGAAGVGGSSSGTTGGNPTAAGSSTLSTLTAGSGSASGGIINLSGASGSPSAVSADASVFNGGVGGASFWGGGGGEGQSASVYGAGGGGKSSTSAVTGTNGGGGVIMIMEFK